MSIPRSLLYICLQFVSLCQWVSSHDQAILERKLTIVWYSRVSHTIKKKKDLLKSSRSTRYRAGTQWTSCEIIVAMKWCFPPAVWNHTNYYTSKHCGKTVFILFAMVTVNWREPVMTREHICFHCWSRAEGYKSVIMDSWTTLPFFRRVFAKTLQY